MTYLEEYLATEFSGHTVMLVASYEAAYATALRHQDNFDVIVAFNCKTSGNFPSLPKLRVTHWCVNLGTTCRMVGSSTPVVTPYHKKWGNLAKAVAFFSQNDVILIHPRYELYPFGFDQIAETLGPEKQPSSGLYLTRRLIEAQIKPTLVGFTGKVKDRCHDADFEQRVLKKLAEQRLIRRIPDPAEKI